MTPTQLDQEAEQAALEKRFRELEAKWTEETEFLSSYHAIVAHESFRGIVGMGSAVVPLILRSLEGRRGLLVWALPLITGEDPVPAEAAGNIRRMTEAWLRWGHDRGLKW